MEVNAVGESEEGDELPTSCSWRQAGDRWVSLHLFASPAAAAQNQVR